VRKPVAIASIALVHLACSWLLFVLSMSIGMKSFDAPHVLTFSERIWTSLTVIMLLPVAGPLQMLTRDLTAPLMDPSRYGQGVQSLAATAWFFGPMVLNSVLWALLIWWAYSRVRRSGRAHAA
jgi:hypothetical protein